MNEYGGSGSTITDEELHLAVASGRIAALARAGRLGNQPAWVKAAKEGVAARPKRG